MTGTYLAHYRILEELGRGGMGIVYLAEDTKLDRRVAIKVLPSSALSSEDDRARFYREAKAAAALNHPHIAAVHQIDEAVPVDDEGEPASGPDDKRPFIAMEYVEGETLDDRIRSGPLRLTDVVRIAKQVAGALAAAHAKDIVHRDIKSANVMLNPDGDAKVLDFGLAQTAASTKLTRMDSTLGTVAYMSPEQTRGEEVDRRTDLWALGVVLYEMVAGRHPFSGDYEQAVIYSILNTEPEPLTALRTGVPMELERIVNKCLFKDVRRRYQSAADVIADLEGVDVSSSSSSHSTRVSRSATPKASAPRSRKRAVAMGTALTILGILIGVASARIWGIGDERELDHSSEAAKRFEVHIPADGPGHQVFISPDGHWVGVTVAGRKLVIRDMYTGETRRYEHPRGFNWIDWSPDTERMLISRMDGIYQANADGSSPQLLRETQGANLSIYGPSGGILFSTLGPYFVRVPTVGSPDTLRWEGRVMPLSRSPTGDVLIGRMVEDQRLEAAWDLESGEYNLLERSAQDITQSGHALYMDLEQKFSVYPLDEETLAPTGTTVPVSYLNETSWDVSTGGTLVYLEQKTSEYELRFRRSGGSEEQISENLAEVYFDLSPTSDRVVVTRGDDSGEESTTIVNVETGFETQIGIEEALSFPAFDPSGRSVYGFRTGALVELTSDGSEPPRHVIDMFPVGTGPINWFPDGNSFAIDKLGPDGGLNGGIGRYYIDSDSLSWIVDPAGPNSGISLSPEGRFLLYVTFDRNLGELPDAMKILELETGRTTSLSLHDEVRAPRWSATGDAIEYQVGDSLMALPVDSEGGIRQTGSERVIAVIDGLEYSVRTADGDIFYTRAVEGSSEIPEAVEDDEIVVHVITNWFEELERIAPTN